MSEFYRSIQSGMIVRIDDPTRFRGPVVVEGVGSYWKLGNIMPWSSIAFVRCDDPFSKEYSPSQVGDREDDV